MAGQQSSLPEGTDSVIGGADAPTNNQPTDGAGEFGDPGAEIFGDTSQAGARADATGTASSTDKTSSTDKASSADTGSSTGASWATGGAFFDRFAEVKTQGYDQARAYAVQGKDRATGALDDLLRMINDAADQVDAKLGNQYGDYARQAASGIANFNDALKGKDVDDLFSDARHLIARAPAVAVGTAAALGFVVARLARAGLDEQGGAGAKDDAGKDDAGKKA